MAVSIQGAQAAAGIRAGMAIGQDPDFDSIVKAGDRDARGGSGQGFGGGEGGDGGAEGETAGGAPRPSPQQAQSPDAALVDPLTDLRGPSAYAPAPPLPPNFTEFPAIGRSGARRTRREPGFGGGMRVTAAAPVPVLRADAGVVPVAGRDWHSVAKWQSNARVRGAIALEGIVIGGLAPFAAVGVSRDGVHPDPLERFAGENRRRRETLDMLFERFETAATVATTRARAAGMRVPTRPR